MHVYIQACGVLLYVYARDKTVARPTGSFHTRVYNVVARLFVNELRYTHVGNIIYVWDSFERYIVCEVKKSGFGWIIYAYR